MYANLGAVADLLLIPIKVTIQRHNKFLSTIHLANVNNHIVEKKYSSINTFNVISNLKNTQTT